MSDSRTVYDPMIPGRTREVPEEDAARWKAAGWLLTAPRDPDRSAEKAAERAAKAAD